MRPATACLIAAMGLFAAVPASAEPSVKVGVLTDLSGAYADLSGPGSVVAAKLAAADFMAANKGFTVEVVAGDHLNKADTATTIARQWFDRDGVDVIADVPNSAAALAVNEVSREKKRVFLDSGAGTADLTGPRCSPYTVHWTYDTWALAHGTAEAMVGQGGNTWFFITADYAFGHAMERDASAVVVAAGGRVLGQVSYPFPSSDFASTLLQAKTSGAKVIGLANGGADLINAIKQAGEFGITQGGQALAGLVVFISDVHALGTQTAQGLVLTEAFYWDHDEATRAWSKRFAAQDGGTMPTMVHAGVYSSLMHYLAAVRDAGSKDAGPVMAKMRDTKVHDPLFGDGEVRADGRVTHPMYLFRVKTPAQSKGPWDLYETLATIPATDAFRPLAEGGCAAAK